MNRFFIGFLSVMFVPLVSVAQVEWEVQELVEGGRIDAIADLGDGVVIAGTRSPAAGMIFRSADDGKSWVKVKELDEPQEAYQKNAILGLSGDKDDFVYLITANAQFWRSEDKGLTWTRTADLDAVLGKSSFSYSICVTSSGTVLVTRGFSVYRSTDRGTSFEKIGSVTDNYLYRLQRVGDYIMANGWGGRLYISSDDGKTWKSFSQLGPATFPFKVNRPYDPMQQQPHLTAIESMGDSLFIQGTMTGHNYVVNPARPDQMITVSQLEGSLDDYVFLGYNTLIGSTFLGERNNYISYDNGQTWENIGPVPTGAANDWLDHVIRLEREDAVFAIGGTNKGFIVRSKFLKKELEMKMKAENRR